jgi:hypothetical protein
MWATRPLLRFCGGTPPTTPHARGRSPPGPPLPTPVAEGLPAFWVPLVAGSLMWATRPLFFILGAHPPNPLGGGLRPLHPLSHPRWLRVCRRFGSHSWGEHRPRQNFPPSLAGKGVRGLGRKGTPPDPHLPTLVGLGFASAPGLTRGGLSSPRSRLCQNPPSFAGKETKGPVLPGPPSLAGRVQGSTLSAEPGLLLQGFG